MPFTPDSDVVVQELDGTMWRLRESVCYEGRDDTFLVPAGFETDFASVPRVVVWLIPAYGVYTRAAILHDYLLTNVLPTGNISSNDIDGIFRRVMQELGVPFARRWLMWSGVRWGAIFNRARRKGSLRTFPKLALISLLALPIVLPGALGVLISLALSASTWKV
jgi:Protein of unknown function (DUF1353)